MTMIRANFTEIETYKIIQGKQGSNILELPVAQTFHLFKSYGILLFRGFNVNYKQMNAFAKQFGNRFILDKDRPIIDPSHKFVTLVDPGMHYVSPHCENANSPFRPDVVWFCCAVPAAKGGETLFWDGVRVWEELSEELKQLFISRKIRFFQKFPAADWKRFLGAGATLYDLRQKLDGFESLKYQINHDEAISLEYICSAVIKTKYSNQAAFANSLISEYKNPKAMVTFEDNSPIPVTVINQIQQVMNNLTQIVPWQSGDLVMIDNSKFLHGRRSFTDTKRRIFSLLSYLNK